MTAATLLNPTPGLSHNCANGTMTEGEAQVRFDFHFSFISIDLRFVGFVGRVPNGVEMPLDAIFGSMEPAPAQYTWWQCYCGACTYALKGSFDNSKYQNPRTCSCLVRGNTVYRKYLFNLLLQMDEPSDCPNIGCSTFLEEMKKLHNFNADDIVWGYAPQKTILMDNLDRTTQEYQN